MSFPHLPMIRQLSLASRYTPPRDYLWNHDLHVYLDIVTRFRRDFGRERKGVLHDILTAVLLINPRYSRRLRYCFLGDEAVNWLLRRTKVRTIAEAVALGEKMQNDGIFGHICCEKPFQNDKMVYKFAFEDDKETIVHILQGEDIWDSNSGNVTSNDMITYEMIADSLENRGFNDAARAFQLIGLLEEKTKAESETMSMSQISEEDVVPSIKVTEEEVYPTTDEDLFDEYGSGPQTLNGDEMSEIRRIISVTEVDSITTMEPNFCSDSIVSNDSDLFYTPPQNLDQLQQSKYDDEEEYQSSEGSSCPRLNTVKDINTFRQKLRQAFNESDVPDYIDASDDEENEVLSNIEALLLTKESERPRLFPDNATGFANDDCSDLPRNASSVTSCCSDNPIDEINETKVRKETNPSRQTVCHESPRKKNRGKESQFARICSAVTILSSVSSSRKSTSFRKRRRSGERKCKAQSAPSDIDAPVFPPRSDTLVYPADHSPANHLPKKTRSFPLRTRSSSDPVSDRQNTQSIPKRSSSLFEKVSGSFLGWKTRDTSRDGRMSYNNTLKLSVSSIST
eukprot:Plantae.Rhodophyta-Hildenbrandia_rubra.ctg17722.p1 GENE.Plantae.Rhodophyta-Hildenbrandia_rubra.ctg17722~~Plantae.Rhodophyta-Hildenbrandia_rubra.ctg17722.p1  ORF type:complete len:567 (-),score=87.30 Plantae.Rhodophyta-Hildenbrandia_rubra.ctg17722:703-2403(-)